jgi:carbon-monoxide dehydrogenase medium subunit
MWGSIAAVSVVAMFFFLCLGSATIGDKTLARAGDAAADEAECILDVRGSAAYKRELLRVYVARAVRQALSSNGATH